ncbi:hypothetical protein FDK15_15025 [Geobacillus thermoleovorans]|nr:hypothetical protein FDK15_15025 [Geobacillus thermoleovorans]
MVLFRQVIEPFRDRSCFLTALFSISWRNGGISKLFAFLFIAQTRPMYYNKHRNRFFPHEASSALRSEQTGSRGKGAA